MRIGKLADYATNHLFVVTANKTTQVPYLLMYAPYKYHPEYGSDPLMEYPRN